MGRIQKPEHLDTQVLVVGAGPTGLVLALWLARSGVRVRIIDKTAGPGTTSRAIAVQARTLELYAQLGIADAVVAHGRRAIAVNLWVKGSTVAHAVFGNMGEGISPFPYALIYPQDEHERFLVDRLAEAGVEVERQTELLGFASGSDSVVAQLKGADGAERSCEVAYLAGCDGAHSIVRSALQIQFPGGTYSHFFYVADVEARGTLMNGELHVGLDATDFLAIFPLKAEGRARFVGTFREDANRQADTLAWSDVSRHVMEWMSVDVGKVNWFSTYRVHHRVADQFRRGRAFILGDAAHIHSPVGGQGMNTGIGDAVNLAWKLTAVLNGRAHASLLDSFEPERIAFARRLVATTDRAFTGVTSNGALPRVLRLKIVPSLVPMLFASAAMRRLMFRTVSQTLINYRQSGFNAGRAGAIRGGDRLPWVSSDGRDEGVDNFGPLQSLDWQVHVYGEPTPELRALCATRRLALHAFAWSPGARQVQLARNAAYLVRPDGYVGWAGRDNDMRALASYLDARGLIASSSGQSGHAGADVNC
jgi:2-polyprenyl-6-methoxyphenol hydroxylase-like FAD-dependent oxidoreductase